MGKTLMWISDSLNITTGYGVQSSGILNGIKDMFDRVWQLGFQYRGQPITLNGITLMSMGYDPWGNDVVKDHISNLRPDYVCTLMDLFRPCTWLREQAQQMKQTGAKTIAYIPIDGDPLPYDAVHPTNVFDQFDYLVPMSHYGRQVILKELPHLKNKVMNPIWHGVDTSVFRPIPQGENNFYNKNPILKGKFIISGVFRNIIRKNPQALVFAFYKFAKGKDDVALCLHSNPNEPEPQGTNMAKLIMRMKLIDKVLFTGSSMLFFSPPPQFVNEVYNVGHVHCLATTGEGFGIPIIEAMAAGKPNIITDYTTSEELLSSGKEKVIDRMKFVQRGCLIPYFTMPPTCYQLTQRGFVEWKVLADAFEWYYQTWKKDKRYLDTLYGVKCREFAIDNFDWGKTIIPQWRQLFSETIR